MSISAADNLFERFDDELSLDNLLSGPDYHRSRIVPYGGFEICVLIGQRHFRGASNRERVPLLAVVNDRTRRENASTTASSAVLHAPASLLGVVVAENVWKPRSNSKQWHTLRQCCRTKWRCPFRVREKMVLVNAVSF